MSGTARAGRAAHRSLLHTDSELLGARQHALPFADDTPLSGRPPPPPRGLSPPVALRRVARATLARRPRAARALHDPQLGRCGVTTGLNREDTMVRNNRLVTMRPRAWKPWSCAVEAVGGDGGEELSEKWLRVSGLVRPDFKEETTGETPPLPHSWEISALEPLIVAARCN
ncbi:hypothetical protein HPB48_012431 [Haemaphysalis longicornis]|uniref:Uncharacterized protein n=1 Tax=Haemaphysalis longicornis TaxID=44386 RepID=A0A9J6FZX4_HAELO|nr:hypothetical protein HPB48_012431 [Haemaphysalis longicornis]